jgi:hypothetical protein
LVHAAFAEAAETFGETIRRLAGDVNAVIVKGGFRLAREEECKRSVVFCKIGELGGANGGVHLGLKVIDLEFIEVAEDDVPRATGDEAGPVVEGLPVVFGKHGAALFHLDEDYGLPNIIGECGAAAVVTGLANPEFRLSTDIE